MSADTGIAGTDIHYRFYWVTAGWLAQWMDCEFDLVETLLAEHFAARGEAVIESTIAAARAGAGVDAAAEAERVPQPARAKVVGGVGRAHAVVAVDDDQTLLAVSLR